MHAYNKQDIVELVVYTGCWEICDLETIIYSAFYVLYIVYFIVRKNTLQISLPLTHACSCVMPNQRHFVIKPTENHTFLRPSSSLH